MFVFDFKLLETKGFLKEVHTRNNSLIFERIKNFQKHNNLKATDFIIGGSSCGSYMDYFIIQSVNDIDIFMLKDVEVEKTEGIDLTPFSKTDGWSYTSVEKDGYYFLSAWDILKHSAIKAVLSKAPNDIRYTKRLLHSLGLTFNEFQDALLQELDTTLMPIGNPKVKEAFTANFPNLHSLVIAEPIPDYILTAIQSKGKL